MEAKKNLLKKLEVLVWIDIETTGFNVKDSSILEVAVVITNKELNVIDQKNVVINVDLSKEKMDNWCIQTHTASGLFQEVKNSEISLGQAEDEILAFIKKHSKEKISPMCGNSVHFDRKFISYYMPKVNNFLYHRCIDVSSLKTSFKIWNDKEFKLPFKKKYEHRAMGDIKESIMEARFYKKIFERK